MFADITLLLERLHWSVVAAAGFVMLLGGGRALVHGAVALARRLGVSTLVVGLTVVAFGTSLPELVFNVFAAASGHSELSFGNVVGSNICNIGLVLGLAALVHGPILVHRQVLTHEFPRLLVVTAVMVALAFAPPSLMGSGEPVDGFGRLDGIILSAMFVGLLWLWYRGARAGHEEVVAAELRAEAEHEPPRSLPVSIMLVVVGLVLLTAGGQLTENGAVRAADAAGLSQSLIGLTVVAVATSLPELFATLAACRAGHGDLAIGNVIGSNLFNIVCVLGVTVLIAPVAVPSGTGVSDLACMAVLTLLFAGFALTRKSRIGRPAGGLLLLLYVGYMTYSVLRETLLASPIIGS
ncbi:MAG: calcium/sodium antiporter [Phycisphaerales bacterium]|nr:calcium/sodium antiporter [Phycisphaerales bacterium]